MRRGAAWPAGRPSSYSARQQAVSRRQMALPPSRHGRQAPQALSIGIPLGGPARGRWAWWPRRCGRRRAFVSVSTSSASGRRPVSGAGVQSPRESVQATGVQCPVRASGCPASGVHCGRLVSVRSRVRCVRPGRGRGGRRWAGSRVLGWPGSACRPPCPRPPRRNRDRGCAGRAGSGEASAWTRLSFWVVAMVVGRWLARPRSRQDEPFAHEDRPVGRRAGCAARWRLRSVVIM
jgi:hypothetical protein